MNEKVRSLVKSKKAIIAALSVLIVGGAVGTYVYQSNQKIEAAQKTLDSGGKTIQSIQKKAESLYSTKDPEFLKEGITDTQIKDVQKEFDATIKATNKKITKDQNVKIKQLKSTNYTKKLEECNALLNVALDKFSAQQAINALFQQTNGKLAMNGDVLNKDLAIADDLSSETFNKTNKEVFVEGASTSFDKAKNQFLTEADNQLKQIAEAKELVSKVIKDGKVLSNDSKSYENGKASVDKIKNQKAKKALLDQLDKVKADNDKQAEVKKQEEQMVASAKAQADQAAAVANQQGTPTAQGNQEEYNYNAGNTGGGSAGGTSDGSGGQAPWTPSGGGNASNGGGTAGNAGGPSIGGNPDGTATQDQLNQAANNASNMDPTKDPNSPWFKP